jgi:class 3 adenylate cyclase
MKRSLVATFFIGAIAAGVALALEKSGALLRPELMLGHALGISPNDTARPGNILLVIALSFGVAWTMLEVTGVWRRSALLALLLVELICAAQVLAGSGVSFQPLPAIVATALTSLLALAFAATRPGQQRRAHARLFRGRLAESAIESLTESRAPDLSQAQAREVTFVFCEIANEAELIEELPADVCSLLTREFIDAASRLFLKQGGYLYAADGEGVCVLFGFPHGNENHAADAARAALAFREEFLLASDSKRESLGQIDLRIGISSGMVVAKVEDDATVGEVVVAGEPLEIARRLARANQAYGSQILLGPRTFSAAGKEIVARPIDFLRSTEAHDRLEVYELLALTEQATPDEIVRRDRFWTGIVYFRERRWNEAFAEFNRARHENGAQDEPLQWYLRRLEPLLLHVATEPAPVAEPLSPL